MTTELSFTGERFLPDLPGEMWAEHWHRYHFVLPMLTGKNVLDVASGEGYGSALMATTAATVSGVDVSPEAVAHARAAYTTRQNLTFTEGSCAKLPFGDGTFDVVVSFETIEHILEQNEFTVKNVTALCAAHFNLASVEIKPFQIQLWQPGTVPLLNLQTGVQPGVQTTRIGSLVVCLTDAKGVIGDTTYAFQSLNWHAAYSDTC